MSPSLSSEQAQSQPQHQPAFSSTSLHRSSSGDSHSSAGDSATEYVQLIRCSRCQRYLSSGTFNRILSNGWSTNGSGMVRFGHNLYYCARCASMVGLK